MSGPCQARSHHGVADGDGAGEGDVECDGLGEGDPDGFGEGDSDGLGDVECDGLGEGDSDSLGELDGEGDSVDEYDGGGWTGDGPWVAGCLAAGDGLATADTRPLAEAGAAARRLEEVPAVG